MASSYGASIVGYEVTSDNLLKTPGVDTMTTYRRADGEDIWDGVMWTSSLDGWTEDLDEPTEIIEEVWQITSTRIFTLPHCCQCDEVAAFWGLCRTHAEEDDPDYFKDYD